MPINFCYMEGEMIDAKVYSMLKVNECGSFAAAAKQLSITQPAVSQHIKALEEELGVRIFERSSGKPVLTKQGAEVVKYALKMVGIYNSLRQNLSDGKSLTTHLTVGGVTGKILLAKRPGEH